MPALLQYIETSTLHTSERHSIHVKVYYSFLTNLFKIIIKWLWVKKNFLALIITYSNDTKTVILRNSKEEKQRKRLQTPEKKDHIFLQLFIRQHRALHLVHA
jgi:hypothetical protein